MERQVSIPAGTVELQGSLVLQRDVSGLVVFAHGSGSSRGSPRNRFVAQRMQAAGLGTLLFDLLTAEEDRDYANRFDIPRLAERLEGAVRWAKDETDARIGLFGASTGAAAALIAAADLGPEIGAVVSRGGRPDLAAEALPKVEAPTRLIVGGDDDVVLELNRAAFEALRCPKELSIVPGATHLFEEPGTLEAAAGLAVDWFDRYLS